jgi:hypothetical protein
MRPGAIAFGKDPWTTRADRVHGREAAGAWRLKLLRRVGPQLAGRFGLRARVDHTDAAKVPRETFSGERARRGGNVPLPRELADDGSATFARACLVTMSSGATSPGPGGGASHVGQSCSSLPDP